MTNSMTLVKYIPVCFDKDPLRKWPLVPKGMPMLFRKYFLNKHTSFYCPQKSCGDFLGLFFFFYKLKVCGNFASIKFISTIFPTAFAQLVSLCHFGNFHTISNFSLCYGDLWTMIFHVTIAIIFQHHEHVHMKWWT